MIPSSITRAAQRAATPTLSASTACLSCLASERSTHQRRQSSSKASSSSPSDDSTDKPAPAAKVADVDHAQPVSVRPPPRSSKGRIRGGTRRITAADNNVSGKKSTTAEPVDRYAGLPSVPSVQGLSDSERGLSNFFSLHRPMSIANNFPSSTSSEEFNALFTTRRELEDPWANGNSAEGRPEDVVYTLQSTVETIESGRSRAQGGGLRWEVISESSSNTTHLDGAPSPRLKSLEELVAQFRPFRPPPPPEPFLDPPQQKSTEKKASSAQKTARGRAKQKTFTATITVTESTDHTGQKTYSASSSPIVRLPEPENQEQNMSLPQGVRIRHDRMFRSVPQRKAFASKTLSPIRHAPSAQRSERIKMFLISVKRQRKLKMKKHKYKKLMKRTRNLRRRLDRT